MEDIVKGASLVTTSSPLYTSILKISPGTHVPSEIVSLNTDPSKGSPKYIFLEK
jgi:hypothetical protein